MANEYVKTSAEELTAMANGLREVGDFTEGQKFIFPSSEYDENPTITYWIYDSNETDPWIELTEQQASELSGYTEVEVLELPTTGETNILYILVIRQMGFAEAYQKAINDFYLKVVHGTLTQEDIEGLVLDGKCRIFTNYQTAHGKSYPNITKIKVMASALQSHGSGYNLARLSNIEEIEVIDPENVTYIEPGCFYDCQTLEKISCLPTRLYDSCFYNCRNLIIGTGYLDLSNCTYYENSCLHTAAKSCLSFTFPNGTTFIGSYAFSNTKAEEIYLPDIPPTLSNINAFNNAPSNLKFYVSSQNVLTTYSNATNWSDLISQFEVITS